MSDPLQLRPDPEPAVEHVQLGNQSLELDPDAARVVREQFEALAGQYSAQLQALNEQYQRATLARVGTPIQGVPEVPTGLDVPDPDLLFSNKAAWTDEFANNLERRLGGLEGKQTAMVQQAVSAFQQELARRDVAAAAQKRHDEVMGEMLDRRGLGEHTLVVQAVYHREFDKLRNLPLEMAVDRIGQLSEDEITKIRSGERWTMTPGDTQTGVTARPPARSLRSARRAGPAPAPSTPAPQGGINPQGELGMMGRIIRQRQAAMLGQRAG